MPGFRKRIEQINRRIGQLLNKGERDIAKQYAQTLAEIRRTIAKYYEKYEIDGKLSYEEMAKYNRLKKLMRRINHLLKVHRKNVYKQMDKILGNAYVEGYYLTSWALETYTQTKLGYTAVSPETLTAMLHNPIAGLTLNERLERNRAMLIYKIQQEVTQGLQENETYGTMSKRLKGALEGDATKAQRIVRTEGHRVQESAKYDSVKHATKNGIVMTKTWNSLEDARVRDTKRADHRELNENTIPVEDNFKGETGEGPAPGMLGVAAEDINCRCFLTYEVERITKPQHDELEDIAFDDWKKYRLKSK